MKKNELIKLYKSMRLIRSVESEIVNQYKYQEIRCPVHLSIGQEAIASGICEALSAKDAVFSTHRCHAHYIAKGGDLTSMICEIYGKVGGVANGKSGSMHLFDLKKNVIASIPIVGSSIPIATGYAFSKKIKKQNDITVVFFGDGATEEGVFFESIDFASLKNLNILFVCENNFYSVYSNLKNRQSKKRSLLKIVSGMGIKAEKIDGNDVVKIYEKTKKIITKMRKKSNPHFLLLDTFRLLEHCGPNNDDDLNYRQKQEIKFWSNNCPIKNLEKKILNKKIINKRYIKNYLDKTNLKIKKIFDKAKKNPFPDKRETFKDIYAK
jgi:TPP-dependent pyruvate/acetoin dehydrogenase alpha subunit